MICLRKSFIITLKLNASLEWKLFFLEFYDLQNDVDKHSLYGNFFLFKVILARN